MHVTIPARVSVAAALVGLAAVGASPASAASDTSTPSTAATNSASTTTAATTTDPTAAFLAAQLASGGGRLQTTAGGQAYDDLGLTIDAVFALDATHSGQAQARRAAAYVLAHAGDYVGTGKEHYAGATAKTLVLTQAQGLKPRAAGQDLVATLASLQQRSGQFKDASAYGDYSNTLGQAFGIIGLRRAGHDVAAPVRFLLQQQCADGGFRLGFTGACTSDADATSVAAQALAATGQAQALARATAYLTTKQAASGGVGGGPTTTGPNANSTGLAAVVFALAGKRTNAASAAAYVSGLHYDCSYAAGLRGAIAYDSSVRAARRSTGKVEDQDRRSSAQAVLALAPVSYATVKAGGAEQATALSCSGPTGSPTGTSTTKPTGTPTTKPTGSPTSTVSGPPVVTDGPTAEGGNATVLATGGALAAVTAGGLVVAHVRRRR